MGRRRRAERLPLQGDINVVSLIDVMMLLLVIFMITAPIMQGGVDVTLPKAEAKALEPKGGMVVTVARDGRVYADDVALTVAEFKASVKSLTSRAGRDGVYLRADRGVPYGTVVEVLGAIRGAGVANVGLVTEPEDIAP